MQKKDEDWTYWTGWIVAYGILAVIFLVVVFWGWFDQPWCAAGKLGAPCLRDWLEALGGWAALLVGGPSLYILWRQVRDADRNQRIDFGIRLGRSRSLARRIIDLANQLGSVAATCERVWDNRQALHLSYMEPMRGYCQDLEYLRDLLRQADFQRFEDEAEILSDIGFYGLIEIVERDLKEVAGRRDVEATPDEYRTMCSRMLHACGLVRKYAEACTSAATRQLAKIKEIAGDDLL
ncbi:hypothetical protein [Rhizobium sp. 11_C7_N12_5]|uniref:hypothetical protein n=1 Tax=Rhizobium sp. 11_C7_N12_5 TaxID=3240770 RepID=UPI003F205B70